MDIFVTKWISGDTATCCIIVQRKQSIDSKCPRCVHCEEGTNHVLICQEESIGETRVNALLELRIWIKSLYTQSNIEHFIFHSDLST